MTFAKLPRQWVLMDDRGRLTVPGYMREALGLEVGKGGNAPVLIEVYPSLENCKALMLKKG